MTFILSAREAANRINRIIEQTPSELHPDLSDLLRGHAELEQALVEANEAIMARTPWVPLLVEAVRQELGCFGPIAPQIVRDLKRERDEARAELARLKAGRKRRNP
jgi:hypothetical protein